MEHVPSVGKVFFPLDEELELLPGKLAPRQHEHLVHLACFMPFDKAAQMMGEIVSVHTNEETVRRLTEQVGIWMEAAQTAEVEADEELEPEHEQPPERCVISPDGAMISLVHKQWVETRTVAIGEPQEKLNSEGEKEIHVGKLSYFSRLADASTFTKLAAVEIWRRKVKEAKEGCAVMDGADWCQLFTERHRPDAVRILDFPHAAEHITKLLEALEQTGMCFPPHMLDRCLHLLKHRGPRSLLRMADRLGSDLAQQKGVQEHLDYLHKREALMQYPEFHSSGWPIGSGMVESANKNVVEARLKGPGMHWQRNNVNPMLALRNAACNDRWKEMWQKALDHHRKLQALHRSEQVKQSPSAAVSEQLSPSAPSPVATPPRSSLPSIGRKCHPARHRVNASSSGSSELSQNTCRCGTPLVRTLGHRSKQYCSDRCRQHAYRKRYLQTKPLSRLASATSLSGSSPAPAQSWLKRAAQSRSEPVNYSLQRSGGVKGETCLFCGTRLVQSAGGRLREYCSGRCRQRAHRERQAQVP
jgi:endogenous inhibitor of DNA gyrase (YacG/DUF329 family)